MIRLNKLLNSVGICSRRKADELIAKGFVSVDGKMVTELGTCVDENAKVVCDNKIVQRKKLNEKIYILLNKPINCICTADDPEGRRTVFDLIDVKKRIFTIGRLDRNTSGVLLLTNDGELAHKMSHPSFEIKKIYKVTLDRQLSSEDKAKIQKGLKLADGFIKVDNIYYDKMKNLFMVLHSGRNHIVRRIFESLNYKVRTLDRISFGGITKENLPKGQWKFIKKPFLDGTE
ncbi:MAG: rRNA pseudouridine synthase [Cytophagales bacterium]|jgi:23S rRNA pseudouridine2605 synthase|nr:rRNA pseudouridine synthase [Cytophagales bacterium]